ncbi:MAG: DUF4202 family protein [Candidatus Liptonbacteria bacterium]|nr:DUF4202 family protein [Candidatus Liptonbacteria bacterium]
MPDFQEVRREISEILKKSPIDFDPQHSELVLKWVLQLKPDADEALQIAALAHDIDRGVTGIIERDLKDYSKIAEFKKAHAMRSAKFTSEILARHGYREEVISKVNTLVKKHEEGGDYESDVLKDADSLAFFEYNIPGYIKYCGEERAKGKIQFMYVRMSPNARSIVGAMVHEDKKIGDLVKNAISELG